MTPAPLLADEPLAAGATIHSKRLDDTTYRYASGSFAADVRVDGDGLVTEYTDLWRRVP